MRAALVHIGDVPAQTFCAFCPKPGNCCKNIYLSGADYPITFWKTSWEVDANRTAREYGLPFVASRISSTFESPDGEYVTVTYSCPKLLPSGRCGIYESRPALCRRYVPAQDGLCCLTPMYPETNA